MGLVDAVQDSISYLEETSHKRDACCSKGIPRTFQAAGVKGLQEINQIMFSKHEECCLCESLILRISVLHRAFDYKERSPNRSELGERRESLNWRRDEVLVFDWMGFFSS